MSRKIMHFLMLAALVAVSSVAMADPPARVGRVTVTEGKVTMLVNGEEESGNLMNWPVTSDNHLTTAPGARAEFRIGSAAVRLDGDSDIEVEQLDDERLRLRLNYGTASVRLRDPAMINEFEFTTPQARITLTEPGAFRVDTERAPDTTVVNVFAGNVRVEGGGNMLAARSGKRVEVRGDDIFTALAVRDRFDEWVATRDRREEGLVASRYVPSDMTGYEDLDHYGNWVEDREYGNVWFPRAVPSGWAPYRDGRWAWISPWGWTWIDNSPWGYAPFHYGRWVVVSGRWCWTPGRFIGRPVWSPALVGWVGGNNWSVSFGSGRSGPAVGWYPLTPRDRYVPGYRISSDYERRLIWNHRTNDRWHERYKDRDHDGRRDGVTALPRDQFDRGRRISVSNVARVAPQDVRNVPQMATPPQVTGPQMRPGRQEWQNRAERDERGNRDRVERGPELRGPDRLIREERQERQERQEPPRQLPQLQAQPQQPQQMPQPRSSITRSDDDDRNAWRNRSEPRRSVTSTQPQQLQPMPQAQPQPQPRFEPQPRLERPEPRAELRTETRPEPRFEPRQEARQEREVREVREDRGRREIQQPQMAPARPVQMAPAPQAQPQPQPQPQPQAQPQQQPQPRRDSRETREPRGREDENRR
ncbi:hypothetical protein GTP41_03265 [Pseudoduganella sp. DS3]|uniref:FecR protein domain-containing protein n=1 Tax=Pseudoduganella guangdongensis TaxID=2692179 RepID=A0A6N9HC25_9BURK|nr:DUF6600 domain-containing protein [Pseudoduganella guangdongensis]MYN01111.1 hypothetical protein [Pseudoduganella guangdongensis]